MKNFLIILLLVALIGENVYIYMQPNTVCDLIKEKGDELVDKVAGSKASEFTQEQIDKIKQEAKEEVRQEMKAKVDSVVNNL